MSYIILRRWCHIIVLNIHAPTVNKIDDVKDSFYEELESMFDEFPKYHVKILSGDFNAEVGREDIFKPTIGKESLHSNDNRVRVVNFATSKNLTVKSMMFPHCNVHKYTWTSPDGKTHNQIDHILIRKQRDLSVLDVRIYKTIILPVVLYGCETWPLTLREKHRLRVSENKVLRIFGPKRDEVSEGWRKLHNEELRDFYSSPSIIRMIRSRRMRWVGHVARMGEKTKVYRLLVGKLEGKRPLGNQDIGGWIILGWTLER
jgi:hypothetical protein